MRAKYLAWAISSVLVTFLVAKCAYDEISPAEATNIEKELEQEAKLVQGKCTKNEMIDRWLLQQSWFYDQQFTDVAGAFGQSSFGMFESGNPKQNLREGVFCIEGRNLFVRYFKRYYFPSGFEFRSPSNWTVKFSSWLVPLEEDVFTVQELTREHMILKFASDGDEHVFYRRN